MTTLTLPAIAGLLALTVGDGEAARTPAAPPKAVTPAARPCSEPAYRQFDFWLGDWEVRGPAGKIAGANRITRILDGCALSEQWTGASGTIGTSLNMYDAGARKWRQTWVDDGGTVLLLTGDFSGGKMVLQGDSPGDGGKAVRQRITWTPLSGGRVRQFWDSSADGGKTWKTEFDGTYTPVAVSSKQ
jgi:hypothetical protein